MSDDLEGVAYESRLEQSLGVPPPDKRPSRAGGAASVDARLLKLKRMLAVATVGGILGVVIGLIGLLSLVLPPGDRAATPDEGLVAPDGGLLADLRGNDVLQRLETTQAALKGEMAMLREAASRGGVPLPDEAETVMVLAAHAARLEHLGALVKRLRAEQTSLNDRVLGWGLRLEAFAEHLAELEQVLEDKSAGGRN